MFYYLFGALLGRYFQSELEKAFSIDVKRKIVMVLSAIVFSLAIFFVKPYININLDIVQNILSVFSLFLILDFVSLSKVIRNTNLSFLIYCMHPLILEVVQKLVYKLLGQSQVIAFFDYIFSPIVTLCIIYVVIKLLKKIPLIYSLACGGRV